MQQCSKEFVILKEMQEATTRSINFSQFYATSKYRCGDEKTFTSNYLWELMVQGLAVTQLLLMLTFLLFICVPEYTCMPIKVVVVVTPDVRIAHMGQGMYEFSPMCRTCHVITEHRITVF